MGLSLEAQKELLGSLNKKETLKGGSKIASTLRSQGEGNGLFTSLNTELKANGFILQQHTEWPDRRKDFPALKVVGHEGYTLFLGVERSFCLG